MIYEIAGLKVEMEPKFERLTRQSKAYISSGEPVMKVKVVGEDTFSVLGDHQWKNAEQVRYDQILAVAPLFYFKGNCSAALGHKRLHRQKLSTRTACRGTRLFFENGNKVDEKTLWYRLYKRIWNGSLTLRRCCLAFLRLSGIEKRSLRKSGKSSLESTSE